MSILFNQKRYKARRQSLRNNSTEPERRLWEKLKAKQFHGYKFRRQHGIGQYIVDFYCAELKLVIEIDGDSHFGEKAKQYDTERDAFLKCRSIRIVRFNNDEVIDNMEGVLRAIEIFVIPNEAS